MEGDSSDTVGSMAPEPIVRHTHRSTRKSGKSKLNKTGAVAIGVIIIVILIGVGGYLYLNSSYQGSKNINTVTNLEINASKDIIGIDGSSYLVYLNSTDPSSGSAQIYITKLPIFLNPLFNIRLFLNDTVKANIGTRYANMEIKLSSVNANDIEVTMIPVSQDLSIAPDSADIGFTSFSLSNIGNLSSGNQQQASTTSILTSTTTISTANTSSSTFTTTTIESSQNQSDSSAALSVFEESPYYGLMVNYSKIYANTLNCTILVYNTSYLQYMGTLPSGPVDYYNISYFVPYGLNRSIKSIGSDNYEIIYGAQVKNPSGNGPAFVAKVNTLSDQILNITTEGAFEDNNYTTLLTGYNKAEAFGNACGAYLAAV